MIQQNIWVQRINMHQKINGPRNLLNDPLFMPAG
jgi:hypothetical protein